jgi:8-oxo-dGTP pyrophosphatase MutT (NUDIX family)
MNKNTQPDKIATVCLLAKDRRVELAVKVAKIGAGCRNGYGGIQEKGESILRCAVRELFEERGLFVREKYLTHVAIVDCYNHKEDGTISLVRVHMFLVPYEKTSRIAQPLSWLRRVLLRKPKEMIDRRDYFIDEIPEESLMPADPFWMKRVLKGEKLLVTAHYGPNQKTLLSDPIVTSVASFES